MVVGVGGGGGGGGREVLGGDAYLYRYNLIPSLYSHDLDLWHGL